LPPPASSLLGGRASTEPLRRTRRKRRRIASANSVCLSNGSTCWPVGRRCTRISRVKGSEPGSRAKTLACHAPRVNPSICAKWGPRSMRCHPFIRAAAACSSRYPRSPRADVAKPTSDRVRGWSERPGVSLKSPLSHAHTVRRSIRGVGCPLGIHPVDLRVLRLRHRACRSRLGRCVSTSASSGFRVYLVLGGRGSGTVSGLLPRFLVTRGHVDNGRNIGVNNGGAQGKGRAEHDGDATSQPQQRARHHAPCREAGSASNRLFVRPSAALVPLRVPQPSLIQVLVLKL